MNKIITTICLAMISTPVTAQSSLGFQGIDLRFGMIQDKAGTAQSDLSARLDVAMTQAHGSQGDVSFADTDQGLIGKLGAHLYIIPHTGQKCGGGGSLSDVDGRIVTWRTLSIESALALSDMTAFEGSAGLGVSDLDGLD